ncbi:hypothetical protein F8O01_13170 [Pseudoclavibacter chungangensis]|uniref:MinD-like ATPase involved in chromosome partitioning or flagellar assembly n=1 Tax=Pseudoclavibacter chungangensis TaxID=587635 RepID=A0A7J5BPM2_9MICO|nr:hypothetical protein [Pseudoclavibacter chungangensis]KAB1654841.1 hypothetical protein F8O01_13170 [Pseudoclavibacter chungangensis]NYJ68036.1 hypothetical protein [Pseudoclavibacter chungangensis]
MTTTTEPRTPRRTAAWSPFDRQRVLVDLDDRVRAPLATSRRIAFLALRGGVGTSTLAARTAQLIAYRRDRPLLAVDAAGAARGLSERLGIPADERVTPPSPRRAAARTPDDAAAGLHTRGRIHHLGLGHPDADSWPADPQEWRHATAAIGRFFGVVITDWGRRRDLATIGELARSAHAICLVAPATRVGLEETAALVPALRRLPAPPDVTIALVDRDGRGVGVGRLQLGPLDANVLRIDHDARLARGAHPRRRTTNGWLGLAAELVVSSARGEGRP